jgi:hypothetical protein
VAKTIPLALSRGSVSNSASVSKFGSAASPDGRHRAGSRQRRLRLSALPSSTDLCVTQYADRDDVPRRRGADSTAAIALLAGGGPAMRNHLCRRQLNQAQYVTVAKQPGYQWRSGTKSALLPQDRRSWTGQRSDYYSRLHTWWMLTVRCEHGGRNHPPMAPPDVASAAMPPPRMGGVRRNRISCHTGKSTSCSLSRYAATSTPYSWHLNRCIRAGRTKGGGNPGMVRSASAIYLPANCSLQERISRSTSWLSNHSRR